MPKTKGKKNFTQKVKNVIRKMSETKCSFSPLSIQSLISSDGEVAQIAQLSQGSANDQRIGSSVQLRHLKIAGQITMTDATGTGIPAVRKVRLMLIYARKQFTPTDLQDYVTGSYDPKQFFPLHDRYYTIPVDYAGGTTYISRPIVFTISKTLRYFQKYNGPASGDQTTGFLTLVLNTPNDGGVKGRLDARQEVWYDDI